MTWVRLEDGFGQHPKVIGLTDAAFRLHVSAICYCSKHCTDGLINTTAARFLIGPRASKYAVELVSAGVWEYVESDTYRIHDFLDYNPSREETEARRADVHEARARAGRAGGLAKASKRLANGQPVAVAKSSPVPSRPDPTQEDDDDARAWKDAYWRNFGHEATEAQLTELDNAEVNHPRACIEWILSEVGAGDVKWRNMRSVRMKLNDCATKGHGPRDAKFPTLPSKKATLTGPDGRPFESGLEIVKTGGRIIDVEAV